MCVFFRIFVCELKEEKSPICRAQRYKEISGQTLNSYYKSHIVNIIDTISSWQLQCKHLVYIILY